MFNVYDTVNLSNIINQFIGFKMVSDLPEMFLLGLSWLQMKFTLKCLIEQG